jgi:hypothetical protein
VIASTRKTMKMMIAMKNRTGAIVAAPAEMLVKPKMPATMEIRKKMSACQITTSRRP